MDEWVSEDRFDISTAQTKERAEEKSDNRKMTRTQKRKAVEELSHVQKVFYPNHLQSDFVIRKKILS